MQKYDLIPNREKVITNNLVSILYFFLFNNHISKISEEQKVTIPKNNIILYNSTLTLKR
ncbi:hypothetical protein KL86DYS2_12964 [uncultured Dysgonomonas sp.]|uniref:Uncharacterized protein n=1 Tax=uncultured Dysgonomonas sp. TaxID=206096 RepID=A0A212K3Z6_9BACT|nr:hypothetical protein KL86DYS2_12964 [uncultured Dysgonomonas sp.]